MAIGNYLTTDEVAEILGITPGRVRQIVVDGRLVPDEKIGNANLFTRENIDNFAKLERKNGRPKNDK